MHGSAIILGLQTTEMRGCFCDGWHERQQIVPEARVMTFPPLACQRPAGI